MAKTSSRKRPSAKSAAVEYVVLQPGAGRFVAMNTPFGTLDLVGRGPHRVSKAVADFLLNFEATGNELGANSTDHRRRFISMPLAEFEAEQLAAAQEVDETARAEAEQIASAAVAAHLQRRAAERAELRIAARGGL